MDSILDYGNFAIILDNICAHNLITNLSDMIPGGVECISIGTLNTIGDRLTKKLVDSTTKHSKYINYQIGLLEVVKHESNRYDHLGYCDYELCYLCYYIASKLHNEYSQPNIIEFKDLISVIDLTVSKYKRFVTNIELFLTNNAKHKDEDPILARFNNLKSNGSLQKAQSSDANSLDNHRYREMITAPELHNLLKTYNILLIDFRTKNEFNYNHINHKDIVNIDPAIINGLFADKESNSELTDQSLEDRLRLFLPDDQFTKFTNRNKYDLIVMYNLRYGISLEQYDRFEILTDLLIADDKNGNPCKNPFIKLNELINFRNKYISSRLKRSPCILSGGVTFWFSVYGETSIAKTTSTPILSRPNASLAKYGSQLYHNMGRIEGTNLHSPELVSSISNGSPYLKNFGDYLGTVKQTKETPISNPFIARPPTTDNYYSPSTSLTPPPLLKSSKLSSPIIHSAPSEITPRPPPQCKVPTAILKDGQKANPTKFLEQYATGLENLGNSCYMNCVLQCLGATPQLTKFFFPIFPTNSDSLNVLSSYRQHINVNNKLGTRGILTTNFVNLLTNMFSNSGKYFKPTEFKRVMGSLSPNKQFDNFDQQDCIEFLDFLLDSLHEDLNQMVIADPKEKQAIMELTPEQEKTREYLPVRLASTIEWERYLKVNFSIIVDYFQGQYMSQLRCLECGLTSTTYNSFLILSLPIPNKINARSNITLDDCLEEFVQLELLDDDNKWHCPHCKRFTRLTKKITITRLPQVLIIHFKRFQISPLGYFSKMDNFIKYPVNDVLDLTSHWPQIGTPANTNLKSDEVMSPEKESQILSTLPTRNQVPPFRYKLYGVANHFGNLTTGHYTAYVYKESDAKKTRGWCYFDDRNVTTNRKENEVLNKNAYCLFYQRV